MTFSQPTYIGVFNNPLILYQQDIPVLTMKLGTGEFQPRYYPGRHDLILWSSQRCEWKCRNVCNTFPSSRRIQYLLRCFTVFWMVGVWGAPRHDTEPHLWKIWKPRVLKQIITVQFPQSWHIGISQFGRLSCSKVKGMLMGPRFL